LTSISFIAKLQFNTDLRLAMQKSAEKEGEFFWEIFERTGSIKAFLLYHRSKQARDESSLQTASKSIGKNKRIEK